MTNIFTQVPANESISTLLELTNTASESYIVSNENLTENVYYTVVGKIPYYHGLGQVDLKYSYEDNIVYYVQKYNDRFFKVISKYVKKMITSLTEM